MSVPRSTIASGWSGPSPVSVEQRVGIGERVERDVRRALRAQSVSRDVERDRVEPRLQAQLGSLLLGHLAERAKGANERVLNDLFGVLAVAGHAQREAIEAALKLIDDRFERSVEGNRAAGRGGRSGWRARAAVRARGRDQAKLLRQERYHRAHAVRNNRSRRLKVSPGWG